MIEVLRLLSVFPGADVEGNALIAELAAASPALPALVDVMTRRNDLSDAPDRALLVFDTDAPLTPAELGIIDAVIAGHNAPAARLDIDRRAFSEEITQRRDELKFLRDNATKTDAQLDTQAAELEAALDAAGDADTRRALLEGYLGREVPGGEV